ncbi:MAG TPA: PVC-type heme-binding CxxCH protein [Verrucomicrobiae bacterium]|nr:PVC-type heme-binding CxxCH protein [Verrucomicrobiae bacterium]
MFLTSASMTAATHHVPDGFITEKAADEQQVLFPMFATFDDRGRLFVAESSGLDLYAELSAQTRKCRVKVLEDRDGDGRFERAAVFADKLVFPMGLVWHDGKLYVADPPDLVTFEDADGDGRADKRTVVLTGFGHKDNGSLHGLIFGPDGLLYMTMGTPDGYRLKRDDGSFLEGTSGALIRCRRDGSGVEVVCRGFVNLVEVSFLPAGEIIGTDNWYQHPTGGIRDALVHLVDGGLYPYEPDVGSPLPVTGESLPPLSLFPAVALSGLESYRGDAFPTEMRGNLFSAQHNTRKVGRHALTRFGPTFRSQDFDFVTSADPDFHPSDVLEDADGSLLVVDTGGWYVQHCPTGSIRDSRAPGGIYRVRSAKGPRREDPWGRKLDWASVSEQSLVGRLGDPRPAVRDRAARILVKGGRRSIASLDAALSGTAGRATKQRVLWVLSQIPNEAALTPVREALKSPDRELLVTAVRVLARRADASAARDLARLLEDESQSDPAVHLAVAEALSRCGDAPSLTSIWRALTNQADPFLEHALVHAAHRIADIAALNLALDHPHPKVRRAGLLLLSQPPRSRAALAFERVANCLVASDVRLRHTALEILRKRSEWAREIAALIGNWIEQPELSAGQREALSGLVLAFQRDRTVQELVGFAMNSGRTPSDRFVFLLDVIGKTTLSELPAAWTAGLERAIDDETTRGQAVRIAARRQIAALEGRLLRIAEDRDQSVELRLEALRGVIGRNPKLSVPLFELLVRQLGTRDNPVARLSAMDVLRRSHLDDIQLSRTLSVIQGDALISPGALLPAFRESTGPENGKKLIKSMVDAVEEGWRPAAADLDSLLERLPVETRAEAGRLREAIRKQVQHDAAKLKQYEPLLTGGNAERGREVFFGNKVACSTCHSIGDTGGNVGPDLTKIGAIRSGRDILESIVLPNATFAQEYDNYLVTTKDGDEITGMIAQQSTDTVELRGASGAAIQVPRGRIQEMTRSTISAMPEGLELGMTGREFRDLLAFLQGLK